MIQESMTGLVTLRDVSESNEEYLQFGEQRLGNAMGALMATTERDVMWKPLNHKVLLSCRDDRASVRLMGVALLHKLVTEIGEDYLSLLPECLPFISESLEDDLEAVCLRTSGVVRLIDDISGEKIETYLG